MAISTSGIEQRLADLKIVAATTNIKHESLVDRLKQIPEVLSTVIEDLKMKNPVVDRKIQEECNKCCNPMREDKKVFEDYEVKSEDIEVTREDKEDDLTYLNRGTKYNNMGSSENNMCDVKLEVQGKPNVPDMQEPNLPDITTGDFNMDLMHCFEREEKAGLRKNTSLPKSCLRRHLLSTVERQKSGRTKKVWPSCDLLVLGCGRSKIA
ncbi:hypothetical protein NDU88_007065 [Pleurodeles waltl]|uniref:Uncharacterized protein n=1 Tax=Pleurodeles waltl TaxID=8319 RepID=A0AAV7VRJ6_PLEWA|nr:hypothetical protein NDU88_007065 [Pleurodeles waltl]